MIPEPKVINTTINGDEKQVLVSERDSLLEALRDRIGMTGAKEGCNNGNCGACAVIMDGRLVNSCCVMAAEADGAEVMTVEGLASREELHPLQSEFLQNAALQCGICTPGFLMSSYALLQENPNPTEEEARFWLAGNLCRCTGYDKIIESVLTVAKG
ncbi:MAG: (2Fe-2S)-binding protein [Dehalococcoidia bacterium]|jgi:carbon-monoxide dehydrogenase small subunit|nr:ferredoxin [Chloroflexota bacterium]MCH2520640.1 (2Fe-2S)-binding protein [Dehalococcoidia bacterium]MEC7788173.1 (2Fe-2S)-binding protein [Chloroflexota bacterium]|tara:strand:- start:342 stop:812 length:471 start_codon:yes stop_codon:yes gene_type:complete